MMFYEMTIPKKIRGFRSRIINEIIDSLAKAKTMLESQSQQYSPPTPYVKMFDIHVTGATTFDVCIGPDGLTTKLGASWACEGPTGISAGNGMSGFPARTYGPFTGMKVAVNSPAVSTALWVTLYMSINFTDGYSATEIRADAVGANSPWPEAPQDGTACLPLWYLPFASGRIGTPFDARGTMMSYCGSSENITGGVTTLKAFGGVITVAS
jgi:hypothetical protein